MPASSGAEDIVWTEGDAEQLPCPDGSLMLASYDADNVVHQDHLLTHAQGR